MIRRAIAGLAFLAVVTTTVAAHAAGSRGLTVPLKANENKDAAIIEEVELYSKSFALVIGIDDYQHWPRLSNGVKDAQLVAAALEASGFDVTLKLNLKSREIKEAFEEFFVFKGANPEARLFVWFAGHGHTQNGEGYIVPADAPLASEGPKFRFKALSLRRFGEYVRQAQSKHAFSIFDSCFSGTIFETARSSPPPAITRVTTAPVRQFLSSGDVGQEVSDDGTFRRMFIEAISGKRRADANGDGYLTASELGLFLTDSVTNYSNRRQTPRYGKLNDPDFDRGDFVFKLASVAPKVKANSPEESGLTPEMLFWQSIQTSKNSADYRAYLKQYPNGAFTSLAKNRLEELKTKRVAVARPPRSSTNTQAAPAVGVYPQYKAGDTFKDCDTCPEMVVIPIGSFMMGDLSGKGEAEERPAHNVRISYKFAVGKFEVTQDEWVAVMGSNPSRYKGGRKPVENVSWPDAKEFVQKLSSKTGKQYRLL